MYTKSNLILNAKSAEEGIIHCNLPMLTDHYGDFADGVGLDLDKLYSLNKYISAHSYAAKRLVFESLGFTVLYLCLGAHKVSHFVNDPKNGKTLNQAFLDGERNVFIFDVEQGSDNLYFVLEYTDAADPLCNHTVDREKLARELARKEQGRMLFRNMMKNRKTEPSEDFPF